MTAHSKFGGSSAPRWMACPGSIGLTASSRAAGDIPEETSSVYAEEGTRAHTLLSECLLAGCEAWEKPELADDVDMILHVDSALRAFRGLGKGETFVEQRVYPVFGRADIFGTVDFAHFATDGTLSVVDFKYGKGVKVDPFGNEQLLFYAKGMLDLIRIERMQGVTGIAIGIHQPRNGGPHITWGDYLTADELLAWGETLAEAVEQAELPTAPLSPGDHCRWCPAKVMCPAQSALLFDGFVSSAPPAQLSDEEIGARLQQVKVLRDYANQLEELVFQRLRDGRSIPGWKLVRKKVSRQWKEGADKILVDRLGDKAYSRSLLSPAAAEKVQGCKELVAEWAYMPETGLTLAPASDSREAQAGGAAAIFAEFLNPTGVNSK